MNTIGNNLSNVSTAFNEYLLSFRQQATGIQLAVAAAALVTFALLSAYIRITICNVR